MSPNAWTFSNCERISRSWLTNNRAAPFSRHTSRIRVTDVDAFLRSRLPVGSSAKTSLGRLASARATATRCCWPIESWRGWCFRCSPRPTRPNSFGESLVGSRSERHSEQNVFQAGVALQQVERLKNVADRGGPQPVPFRFAQGGHFRAGEDHPAGVRLENAGDQVQEGGFARAALAIEHDLRLVREDETLHVDDLVVEAFRVRNAFLSSEISSNAI